MRITSSLAFVALASLAFSFAASSCGGHQAPSQPAPYSTQELNQLAEHPSTAGGTPSAPPPPSTEPAAVADAGTPAMMEAAAMDAAAMDAAAMDATAMDATAMDVADAGRARAPRRGARDGGRQR